MSSHIALEKWFLSATTAYFAGLLVACGLLLQAAPWLFDYLASGDFVHKVPAPIAPLVLSNGFSLLAAHCSAHKHLPGKAYFGLLSIICLFQSLYLLV